MNHLNLTQRSTDQLVVLIRAAFVEVRRRDLAAAEEVQNLIVKESKRMTIAQGALEWLPTDVEGVLPENLTAAQHQQEQDKAVIRRAAELCGMDPHHTFLDVWSSDWSTSIYITVYGPYTLGDCIVYYDSGNAERDIPVRISTAKHLVRTKKELLRFCADIAARWKHKEWDPNEFSWED